MSEEIWRLCSHVICLAQNVGIILIERVYLGKGKVRCPDFWAGLLSLAGISISYVLQFGFFTGMSILAVTAFLVISSFLYGGSLADKVVSWLIAGMWVLLVENSTLYTCAWLLRKPIAQICYKTYYTFFASITLLLTAIVIAHYTKMWKEQNALDRSQITVTLFFPIVAVILNLFLMTSNQDETVSALYVMLTLGLSVAVGVHVVMVRTLNVQIIQRQKAVFLAQLEAQRAEALGDSYTAQRSLTHEFTNHMTALGVLLEQGEIEDAKKYLADITKSVACRTLIMNTHHPLIDSLLSKYYSDAMGQNVRVYFDLCDLSEFPLGNTDATILISNLLSNAIRAAAETVPGEIYVRIKKRQDEYVLSVRNRVQHDLQIAPGKLPASTKKEPGHGMGLANVRDVLKKYNGEYTISCRDLWFRFTCSIPCETEASVQNQQSVT